MDVEPTMPTEEMRLTIDNPVYGWEIENERNDQMVRNFCKTTLPQNVNEMRIFWPIFF